MTAKSITAAVRSPDAYRILGGVGGDHIGMITTDRFLGRHNDSLLKFDSAKIIKNLIQRATILKNICIFAKILRFIGIVIKFVTYSKIRVLGFVVGFVKRAKFG